MNDSLEKAVINGDVASAERLINEGAKIDHALLFQAPLHKPDVIRDLFNIGFYCNTKNSEGDTLLIKSIKEQNDKLFRVLINYQNNHHNSVDRDIKDADGHSPLHLAVENNLVSYVKGLLSTNIFSTSLSGVDDIDAIDKNGESALFSAIRQGYDAIATELLESGASVSIQNIQGMTPLQLAKSIGRERMVILIEETIALRDADRIRTLNNALLENAAGFSRYEHSIQCFIDQGADINVRRELDDATALMLAASGRRFALTKITELVKAGADVNLQDAKGYTALMYAVEAKDVDAVKFLCESGAKLETKNKDHRTALFLACTSQNPDVLDYLIQRGAEVDSRDQFHITPLNHATHYGHIDSMRLLLDAKAEVDAKTNAGETPLMLAAYAVDTARMRLLLKHDADINAKNKDGETALTYAMHKLHVNAVKLLLKNGADVNVQDEKGNSPLMSAIRNDKKTLVNLFMSKDADVNVKNLEEDTALMRAVRRDNIECVSELIAKGADVNAAMSGQTVLMQAADRGDMEIVKLLVENKADLFLKDNKGRTAYDFANGRYYDLTKFLLTAQEQQILNSTITETATQDSTFNF